MLYVSIEKPTFDFDSDTLAVLRGRLVRYFIRKKEVFCDTFYYQL